MLNKHFRNGAAILLAVGFSTIGCNNNDTSSSTTTTMSDTASVMKIDSSGMSSDTAMMSQPAATTMDTTAATTTTTTTTPATTSKMTGAAKPNPAKKGLKGKVTVTAPPKSSAKMEMDNTGVYSNVEYIPSFPGGNKGLQSYFDKNLQYPDDATSEGIEGTVNVSFVVDENGKLSNPQIVGNRMGYGLDEEALRVVKNMPTWNPGKLKGQNVKTRYTLPIRFALY